MNHQLFSNIRNGCKALAFWGHSNLDATTTLSSSRINNTWRAHSLVNHISPLAIRLRFLIRIMVVKKPIGAPESTSVTQ